MVALTGTDTGLRPIRGFTWIGLDDVKLWGLGSGPPFRLVMQWDFDRCSDIIVSADGPVTVRFVTDDEPEGLVALSGSRKLAWLVKTAGRHTASAFRPRWSSCTRSYAHYAKT